MPEPIWLTFDDVSLIHADQIRRFGGLAGTKDENLVHSAIAVPRNRLLYADEDDLLALAIRLCIALAKNHGFADGNKRTATASMIEFLAINGHDLMIPDDEADMPLLGRWVEGVVADTLSEAQLRRRLAPFLQEQDG